MVNGGFRHGADIGGQFLRGRFTPDSGHQRTSGSIAPLLSSAACQAQHDHLVVPCKVVLSLHSIVIYICSLTRLPLFAAIFPNFREPRVRKRLIDMAWSCAESAKHGVVPTLPLA